MKTKSKPKMTEEKLIEARDALFAIQAKQNALREEELEIREYIVGSLYPADKEEGATTITVGDTKVTLEKKFNRNIGKAEIEELKAKHPKLYAEVLSWQPKIRNGVYKQNADVMDKFITTSPAPSTVVFK